MLNKGYYRISIVLAFSCGRAKTTRIRYVWMRVFLKKEKKISVLKISGYVWTGLIVRCLKGDCRPLSGIQFL